MIPFIFSSLAIAAVGRAAMAMVQEVRRQFKEIPGIMEYKAKPEYEKCVAISTTASIKEMIAPGAIALIVPVIVGFTFGPEVLGGVLAGVTVSGVLMGMFQSNAGGAWDNAKKSFEKGVDIDGQTYFKGSDPHKASVTGDTVGDPFKDTSGPSMNILIKLMSIVSLVIAPHIAGIGTIGDAATTDAHCGAATEMGCPYAKASECHSNQHCGDQKKECCMPGRKCDMNKVVTLSKEACAAYCDSIKCSPEERAICMKHAGCMNDSIKKGK